MKGAAETEVEVGNETAGDDAKKPQLDISVLCLQK